jgi:hypothetical protein
MTLMLIAEHKNLFKNFMTSLCYEHYKHQLWKLILKIDY